MDGSSTMRICNQDPSATDTPDGNRSSSPDSLFDSPGVASDGGCQEQTFEPAASAAVARCAVDPIPGLFLPLVPLPVGLASDLLHALKHVYFPPERPSSNQVMLFGTSMFPAILLELLSTLADILHPPALPEDVYSIIFPKDSAQLGHARQAIVNMYKPGEGITAHVDLLERYGDGIVGVSLGSGCAMRFRKVKKGALRRSGVEEPDENEHQTEREAVDVWLPERSVVVLTSEARFAWTHGIERVDGDWVEGESGGAKQWVERGERVSVTFRWLLSGAMVVGDEE